MFSQGVKLLDEGNARAALPEFQQALSHASTEGQKADALYNIAICHVQLGSLDAAIEAIAQAVAADPALATEIRSDQDFAALSSNSSFQHVLRVPILNSIRNTTMTLGEDIWRFRRQPD